MTRDVDLDEVINEDFNDPRGGFEGQPKRSRRAQGVHDLHAVDLHGADWLRDLAGRQTR